MRTVPGTARLAPLVWALVGLAFVLPAGPAHAGLLNERLSREPFGVQFGPGTARLDAMGLAIAAPDENNEINLFDFGDNPAGLLADRDAWSLDSRYEHRERFDRDPEFPGNEFLGNTYSILAAFRNTGTRAVGLSVDYLDSKLGAPDGDRFKYKQTRYRLIYNQMFGKLSAAAEFRYMDEKEDQTGGDAFYNIEHNTASLAGLLGASYQVHPYASLSARGAIERTNIEGRASSDAFDDNFDWERPAGSLEGQAFFDNARLKGAVTYGVTEGAGEETIDAAWSPLFVFNPGPYFVEFEATTFTEDNQIDQFRTRWEYAIVPGRARVAGSYSASGRDYTANTNPIVIGSVEERFLSDDRDELGLGGSLTLLNDRLLVGAEYGLLANTLEDLDPLTGYVEKTDIGQFNVGGEFIAADNLALRGGLSFRSIEREDRSTGIPEADYRARRQGTTSEQLASFGVGWVPRGGALQIDAAYTAGIGSDYELTQNRATLYARVLF
jgi:hypothetical protein